MSEPQQNGVQILYLLLGCVSLATGIWAGLQQSVLSYIGNVPLSVVPKTPGSSELLWDKVLVPAYPTLSVALLALAAVLFALAAWIHARH